jgi:hypothetical protein
VLFCFDKSVFLEYQKTGKLGKVHYINPGNPVFDSLIKVVLRRFKEDLLKGTVLISPEDTEKYYAFFIRSQITDNRSHGEEVYVTDEKLMCVEQNTQDMFKATSPARFLDLHPPREFAKIPEALEEIGPDSVIEWAFNSITLPQFETAKGRVAEDIERRKTYLEESFTHIIYDLTAEINELQSKVLLGNSNMAEKIRNKQERMEELKLKRAERIHQLERMQELSMKPPEVLGCAYVVPLSELEYEKHYGMRRDTAAEIIAMESEMKYEAAHGWTPEDVSSQDLGYDIKSVSTEGLKRYIEVKGRSKTGGVMLSENEMNRLAQLGASAWLYIVIHCSGRPELYRFQDPAKTLRFEMKSKGVQFYLAQEVWTGKIDAGAGDGGGE